MIRVGHKIVFVLFRFVFLPVRPASSRVNSLESFVSAVEEPDDLMKFDDEMLSPSHFVITSPSLVYKYSQHLGQLECLNWNSPLMIPAEQRLFSITNNLKVWLMGLNFFQLNISLFYVKQSFIQFEYSSFSLIDSQFCIQNLLFKAHLLISTVVLFVFPFFCYLLQNNRRNFPLV